MKKAYLFSLLLSITLACTSCTVNWFGETADVPWYYVAIPVSLIFIVAYVVLMSQTYVCPRCHMEFKAKPYQFYVTVHWCNQRIAKCPHCGRKGFCKIKK